MTSKSFRKIWNNSIKTWSHNKSINNWWKFIMKSSIWKVNRNW
jgi:hypothetical protein